MKKILAILLVAVLLSTAVFAQIEPVVNAEGVLTWGVDLGSGKDAKATHGFENYLYALVKFPIYKGSFNTEKDADVYIDFNIDAALNLGKEIERKNSTNGKESIEAPFWSKIEKFHASLHFFGAYITVYDRPDFSTNFAKLWPWMGGKPWNRKSFADSDITGFGTKLGYASKDLAGTGVNLDVGLKFGSNGAWYAKADAGTPDVENYELKKFTAGTDIVPEGNYYEATLENVVVDGKMQVHAKPTGSAIIADGSKKVTDLSMDPSKDYLRKTVKKGKSKDPMSSKYAMGIDLSFGFQNYVYLDLGFNLTFDPREKYMNAVSTPTTNEQLRDMAVGFAIGTKAVEGLHVRLGMDAVMNTGVDKDEPKTAIDVSLDASYKWVSAGIYIVNKETDVAGFDEKGEPTANLAFRLAFMSAESGDTNFVEGLAFGVDFRAKKLLTYISKAEKDNGKTVPLGFKLWASYKASITDSMWLKPYFNLWGQTNVNKYADDTDVQDQKDYFGIVYNVGLEFGPMEKVVVFFNWKHGKTQASYIGLGDGIIAAPCQHNAHNGTFTMGMKLVY